ncbi:3-oxoacyl-ACP reductase [Steroidobacter agaridevorans]|uniref:3-oxoacyl-ACP reductase n=1 Tax=Steroidobacter agaridevorans TaxID=2695856 RepID=A0A829Y8A6_9GAMM|nr:MULTISPECIES: SDR family NAD(P)-dependent oxidoreductase [Steroidobacteraceae]GFE79215.1 3-oxoacyl-ACP reductase [Steroidobacter agaridevorans]GFE87256.1 3-oxoacyl-ACP reductase [Steroidobacter agaridevorans]
MNRIDLEGRIAVVTGGASGIGAAIAQNFIASGATVVIWDLERAEHQLGEFLTTDVADESSVGSAMRLTMERHGRVDILVNSAGIAGPTANTWEYSLFDWQRVQRVNLDGTFLCCRAVVPAMLRHRYGRIVNIASIAGKEGNPKAAAYSASKAAVIALTKSLGKELAAEPIAVNCITPAAAKTKIFDAVSEDFITFMLSKIPRGRFLEVSEVASMVAWLASTENSFTTGAVFDLSGGRATY